MDRARSLDAQAGAEARDREAAWDVPASAGPRGEQVRRSPGPVFGCRLSRVAGALLAVALLVMPLAAAGQPAGRLPRIGILRAGSPPEPPVEAFRQALRDLGYVDRQNVEVVERWAHGRDEDLPALAAGLVQLPVDVIVAGMTQALLVRRLTTTVPIVMPVATDPVGAGLVASLARPGGNVTGLAFVDEELPGKWMELLKQIHPGVGRVGVLWHPTTVAGALKEAQAAAGALGLGLVPLKVERTDELDRAVAEARRSRVGGLVVLPSPFFYAQRARIVELAARYRLPAIYHQTEFVSDSRGLMAYGPSIRDMFRRAATYVDRILKGTRPADLPIERPTRFELVINLRAARSLGLTVPPDLLARADEVIR